MIEALFKKNHKIYLILIIIFNLILSYQEQIIAENNKIFKYYPTCKNFSLDFNINYNHTFDPSIGLSWLISHNLLINWKTTLNNQIENDIKSHNLFELDISLKKRKSLAYIVSFGINKLRQTDYGNYTWYENSFILHKK